MTKKDNSTFDKMFRKNYLIEDLNDQIIENNKRICELEEENAFLHTCLSKKYDKNCNENVVEIALHIACNVIKQYIKIVFNDNASNVVPECSNLEEYYKRLAKEEWLNKELCGRFERTKENNNDNIRKN